MSHKESMHVSSKMQPARRMLSIQPPRKFNPDNTALQRCTHLFLAQLTVNALDVRLCQVHQQPQIVLQLRHRHQIATGRLLIHHIQVLQVCHKPRLRQHKHAPFDQFLLVSEFWQSRRH